MDKNAFALGFVLGALKEIKEEATPETEKAINSLIKRIEDFFHDELYGRDN